MGIDPTALTVEAIAILRTPGVAADRAGLDAAIDLLRTALAETPRDSEHYPGRLANLSGALNARYLSFGDPRDVDECVELGRLAVAVADPGHETYAISQTNLSAALRLRFDRLHDPADLDEAITACRAAVAASAPGDVRLAIRLSNLANGMRTRAEVAGALDEIVQAAEHATEAYELCPRDHPGWAAVAANLSLSLYTRYRVTDAPDDLTTAVEVGRDCLKATPERAQETPLRLANTSLMIRALVEHSPEPGLSDEALSLAERAVRLVRPQDVDRPLVFLALSGALLARYQDRGDLEDLRQGVAWARETVSAGHIAGYAESAVWRHLSHALQTEREAFGDSLPDVTLDEAVEAGQIALDALADAHPDRSSVLNVLSSALHLRFETRSLPEDLERAIELGREALELLPSGRARTRAAVLSTLSVLLTTRHEAEGSLEDIREAAAFARREVEAVGEGPLTARALNDLGGALLHEFEATGDPSTLHEGIEAVTRSVALSEPHDIALPIRLISLGNGLRLRAELLSSPADADASIDHALRARDVSLPGGPVWIVAQAIFSTAAQTRYELTASAADLDTAIQAGRDLLDHVPVGHADRPASDDRSEAQIGRIGGGRPPAWLGYLSNQGAALHSRFSAAGAAADLDAAIDHFEESVWNVPANPRSAGRFANLSAALRVRHRLSGDRADAEEAVWAARQALEGTPTDHPDLPRRQDRLGLALESLALAEPGAPELLEEARELLAAAVDAPGTPQERASRLSNQGGLFLNRFGVTGSHDDLDAAVRSAREAVAICPPDEPLRPQYLSNLAVALHRRHRPDDLTEAIGAYREAAGSSVAPAEARAGAARGATILLAERGEWAEATDMARTALELFSRTTDRGLDRGDQERRLRPGQGLASLAAACAIADGSPQTALELLEAGRGVLFAQSLDLRTDLSELHDREPALAARFAELRDRLDAPVASEVTEPTVQGAAWEGERRRVLVAELDEVTARIRNVRGFGRFLLPPRVSELTAAASSGPVVVVNAHALRSDALILRPDGVTAVPLPELTPSSVRENVLRFFEASGIVADDDVETLDEDEGQKQMEEVLAWLWDVIAKPVLDALTPTPSRVWWCPVGTLSNFPLHAAGRHGTSHAAGRHGTSAEPAPTVLDRTVSSYTPTVRALLRPPSLPGTGRMTVVAMPQTPGASPLPQAAAEARAVASRFPGRSTVLTGPQATRERVLDALSSTSLAHFACHAVNDLAAPSHSHLLIEDDAPLTVRDIAALRHTSAELAYLSACTTSLPGVVLPDESIHLASAFQLAGYRHVIATLWPVHDRAARRMAETLYTSLTPPGSTSQTAQALHTATHTARSRWPTRITAWAPLAHYGP